MIHLYFVSCFKGKNQRGITLRRKKALLIATNLTSIYCVYKKKIVENELYRRMSRSVQKNSESCNIQIGS